MKLTGAISAKWKCLRRLGDKKAPRCGLIINVVLLILSFDNLPKHIVCSTNTHHGKDCPWDIGFIGICEDEYRTTNPTRTEKTLKGMWRES